MQTSLFKKNRTSVTLILFFIATSFFFACQKQVTGGGPDVVIVPVVLPDLSTKINSSVSGFVTDENNAAVIGAIVTAGTSTASTDKYGYFEITNASVVKVAAVVTVTRPGYFKGIKTYTATDNKSAFFRIKLLPKTIAGNIAAGTGGTVALANGLSVSIPANAIVNNATGIAYTGTVNIAAYWISPTSNDLNKIMPGDLRGIDTVGAIKILTTYGMAAVELTGAAGELLQIAPNKKATLAFPIPSTIISKAPATIPLWYFDEANGLWKQQGSATKTGNNYVGEVSHFSFWNCDVPFADAVKFSCLVVDEGNHPIPNVTVAVYSNDSTYTGCHGLTDSSGYVSGAIPANSSLTLKVYSDYNCDEPSISQKFVTSATDILLGSIAISSAKTATITGNVINCAGKAIVKGYILATKNGQISRHLISSTGTFSFVTTFCSANSAISLYAVDLDSLQQSASVTFALTSGTNTAGTLTACDKTIQQFIKYTLDGKNYSLIESEDDLSQYVYGVGSLIEGVQGIAKDSSNSLRNILMEFSHDGIAANSSQNLQMFRIARVGDLLNVTNPTIVNITEYGSINQFISGNFSGSFKGKFSNIVYTIACTFRVKHIQ